MQEYIELPDPIGAAMHFVQATHEASIAGVEIDTAQVLASKVACVALREYFARVCKAVEYGKFDPYLVSFEDFHDYEDEKFEQKGTPSSDGGREEGTGSQES